MTTQARRAQARSALDDRSVAELSTFHVLVPIRHVGEGLFWSEDGAHAIAQARLGDMLERFRDGRLDVTGGVGDTNRVAAVDDVLLSGAVIDEVVVSTLPSGASHWLGLDVPQRVARALPWIPVSHVVSARAPDRGRTAP